MKILLINPGQKVELNLWNMNIFRFPSLSLTTLASLTPKNFEVTLIDDNIEKIDFEVRPDLIAITCMTCTAPRAYEIADRFMEKNIPVILGGIHPTILPDEALRHADSVVIGEAEGLWNKLLDDFQNGSLKKIYENYEEPDLHNLPIPKRELLNKKIYFTVNTVQTTRGCPFSCDFCSVTRFFGNTYRFRPVDDVINEVSKLKGRLVFLVDDNIIGNRNYAKALFERLIPLKIKWVSQSPITISKDDELLSLCSKSGCVGLFIGFESLSQDALNVHGKKFIKVIDFKDAVKKLHDYNLGVEGAFIFGFDCDDTSVFQRTLEFAESIPLDGAQFSILTPLPGTRLYERLKNEGRITTEDWSLYDAANVVFRPNRMTEEELLEGFIWSYKNFYRPRSIWKRLSRSRTNPWLYIPLNIGFRKASRML